ncbi:hypothetical protein DdX_21858 [Ditylenchus destructor]|uniref:Uncharacterized protein n=1 Tax=Ditylenchus destructor TaxID=166010 RepID=A0AAD4QV64_9BILA|nr:hypothetical protein DdX_21858 [Ditylenchus destructor]
MFLILAAPPVAAQDLPTDQLDRHADTVRQNSVLRSNLRQSYARQNARNVNRASSQAAACANRARFRPRIWRRSPQGAPAPCAVRARWLLIH